MPPFSGIWQSLPGPGLLNAHGGHTRDSVSQAAPAGPTPPRERGLSSLLAWLEPRLPEEQRQQRELTSVLEMKAPPTPPTPLWEAQSWEGKCVCHPLC